MNARQAREISDANNPLQKQMQMIFGSIEDAAKRGATSVMMPIELNKIDSNVEGELTKNGYKLEHILYLEVPHIQIIW